jgi:hypothetical protein
MKKIAANPEYAIYDDGDSWVTIHEETGTEIDRVLKKIEPVYPSAACLKWGYEPIDVDFINKLGDNV